MSQAAKSTIALISGANQGIGKAVASRLAREHGYTTIIGSRSLSAGEAVAEELQNEGHSAVAVQLDVTSDESIAAAARFIDEKFGRLDVLVNNAGILIDGGSPFKEQPKRTTRELFDQTFAVNVIGTACLTEALLPLLRRAASPPGPRVLFVTSLMGTFAGASNPHTNFYAADYKAYDSSKAAVNMLMLNYSRILADVGGHVNAVCPGLVATNLIGSLPGGSPPEVGAQRIVELATAGEDAPRGTLSNKDGLLDW